MQIMYFSSTEDVLKEIGQRIKAARIALPATQKEFAEKTNLTLKTISNLENGKDVSFSTMIAALRALNMLQTLDMLLPEQTIHPSQIVSIGKARERAPRNRTSKTDNGWKWGDER